VLDLAVLEPEVRIRSRLLVLLLLCIPLPRIHRVEQGPKAIKFARSVSRNFLPTLILALLGRWGVASVGPRQKWLMPVVPDVERNEVVKDVDFEQTRPERAHEPFSRCHRMETRTRSEIRVGVVKGQCAVRSNAVFCRALARRPRYHSGSSARNNR
jgi:hypothetical protein